MEAYNKKKKPKHFTKTKLKIFDDIDYFPTWLTTKRVSWIENGMTSTIKYHIEKFKD